MRYHWVVRNSYASPTKRDRRFLLRTYEPNFFSNTWIPLGAKNSADAQMDDPWPELLVLTVGGSCLMIPWWIQDAAPSYSTYWASELGMFSFPTISLHGIDNLQFFLVGLLVSSWGIEPPPLTTCSRLSELTTSQTLRRLVAPLFRPTALPSPTTLVSQRFNFSAARISFDSTQPGVRCLLVLPFHVCEDPRSPLSTATPGQHRS